MPIGPSERISRFVPRRQRKNYISPSKGIVKYNAFMPRAIDRTTSVFRTSGLSEKEAWDVGTEYVGKPMNQDIIGRADIEANCITKEHLDLEEDQIPHPLHANIIGWPEVNNQQKQIAYRLAAKAACVIRDY